jgi:EAL domain-containing protein (putative c-di-GMP-specific phosphodiesterase class I)
MRTGSPQSLAPNQAANDHLFVQQLDRLLAGELPMSVHFQPIVDLSRGVVTGYEALARFPTEMGSKPDICFAGASRTGRSVELEKLVTRLALEARKSLPQGCFLTINVGPAFLVSAGWQEVLAGVTDLVGVVVEITEEASISDYKSVRACATQIRAMGGSVAVDDAGAGYASLHHVLEIKPNFIKLDRHFIESCHTDRAKATLIEMMGGAANRLDAWIIAEGVETLSELEELIRLEVPLAQGFYLARPAADMKSVAKTTADLIRRRQGKRTTHSLEQHTRSCAACKTVDEAQLLLTPPSEYGIAVITDEYRRPIELVEHHPLLGIRTLPSFMRVNISSAPAEVLHRAITREAASRFDPIIVTGSNGECLGVTAVDQLVSALL